MSLIEWFQSWLLIPDEYSFIMYLALAAILFFCVVVFVSLIASILGAPFSHINRR